MNTGEDEELHALVTGPTTESVQKAVSMVGVNSICLSLFLYYLFAVNYLAEQIIEAIL